MSALPTDHHWSSVIFATQTGVSSYTTEKGLVLAACMEICSIRKVTILAWCRSHSRDACCVQIVVLCAASLNFTVCVICVILQYRSGHQWIPWFPILTFAHLDGLSLMLCQSTPPWGNIWNRFVPSKVFAKVSCTLRAAMCSRYAAGGIQQNTKEDGKYEP